MGSGAAYMAGLGPGAYLEVIYDRLWSHPKIVGQVGLALTIMSGSRDWGNIKTEHFGGPDAVPFELISTI